MKVKVKLENATFENGLKHIDKEVETNGTLYKEEDYTKLAFLTDNNQMNILVISHNTLLYELHLEKIIKIFFSEHKETVYKILTMYGDIETYIYTEELILNDNYIYVKYFAKGDEDNIHQITINISNL